MRRKDIVAWAPVVNGPCRSFRSGSTLRVETPFPREEWRVPAFARAAAAGHALTAERLPHRSRASSPAAVGRMPSTGVEPGAALGASSVHLGHGARTGADGDAPESSCG